MIKTSPTSETIAVQKMLKEQYQRKLMDEKSYLFYRRILFASLVTGSALFLVFWFSVLLGQDGFGIADFFLLACFAITLPWTLIGFWNAMIGLVITLFSKNSSYWTCPPAADPDLPDSINGKTAIVMTVHQEDPERVFGHLGEIVRDLSNSGLTQHFEFHVLSDTQDKDLAQAEHEHFLHLKNLSRHPEQIFYRRRSHNTDFKNGNLWEFLDRRGRSFDYFLLLDADSLMTAKRISQMVRMMDVNPKLGILQSLVVGLSSKSAFARIFQFGMRQGMRSYTNGSAWWQGNAGPCWGHNVIIRTDAFMQHCKLPRIPGNPPLGGLVLSHDQVEAAMMRGAGYDVRVIVEEGGSYEENPPTLQEFIKRDLRWCQGNMQYLSLLNMPGLLPMGRVQLLLAIWMYVSAPAWIAFVLIGLAKAVWFFNFQATMPEVHYSIDASLAIGLFAFMMTINLVPKMAGLVDILASAERRRSYGGTAKVLVSGFIELVFSILTGPVVAVAQTIFVAGLFFKKSIKWDVQQRSLEELSLAECFKGLWPQTLLGLILFVTAYNFASPIVIWMTPILISLILSAPLAWLTSRKSLGEVMEKLDICATPEEIADTTPARRLPVPLSVDAGSDIQPARA